MYKILLAEDDLDFGYILKKYLEINQFEVVHKTNGELAWAYLQNHKVDFCILDVMMPKMDGFDLAQRIKKQNPEMPFLFLTAKQMSEDVIKGLKIGADDYITKPFEVEELLLRIKNILARTNNIVSEEYIIGKYTFIPANLNLIYENENIKLTTLESDLLIILLQNKNKIVKREVILKKLWKQADYFTGRSMDVFISRLRKHLKQDETVEIRSFRGKGVMIKF